MAQIQSLDFICQRKVAFYLTKKNKLKQVLTAFDVHVVKLVATWTSLKINTNKIFAWRILEPAVHVVFLPLSC